MEAKGQPKLLKLYLKNKSDVMVPNCNSGYLGGRGRRIAVRRWPWQMHNTQFEKQTKKAKGLEAWCK
jgi:hypothetical protein